MKQVIFNKKMSLKEKVGYGVGDTASNFVYNGLSMFIMIFWTNVAGINPATAGLILLVSRIFDGLSDIIVGYLVDKTKSTKGKTRPWILYLALPFAVSAMITFWTPSSSEMINAIYAFISYNVTMTLYTAINIPYGLLAAKMTSDPVERGKLGIFRSVGAVIGIMLVSVAAPVLIDQFGFTITFAILGVIGTILFFCTYVTSEEIVGSSIEDEDVPLKIGLKALVKNRAWFIMLLAGLIMSIGMTLRMTVGAYYAQYILQDMNKVGLLVLVGMPGMLLGMGLASVLFKKIGKVKTFQWGMFLSLIIYLPFAKVLMATTDVNETMLYLYILLSNIPMGLAMSGLFPLIGDTIEYGEWKTGVRVEGLTYSAASVSQKVGGGLGAALVGWILATTTFDASITTQSEDVLNVIVAMYTWIPVVFLVLNGILMLFQDVDKMQPTIQRELAWRVGEQENGKMENRIEPTGSENKN